MIKLDAGGCHKVVTKKNIEKKGDYILWVKGNQQNLHDELDNPPTQVIAVEADDSGCGYWNIEEKCKAKKR